MQTTPAVLRSDEAELIDLGGIGVRFLLPAGETEQRVSVVEHPLAPRALAAPLHLHRGEDEYSFVISGRVGVQLGEEVTVVGPGAFVRKPRNQWHTFWNAGDDPARILEIITPGGFEEYFREIASYLGPQGPDIEKLMGAAQRYGLEFDMASLPALVERHGLVSPDMPPEG